MLGVDHGNGASQRAGINEHVEVDVDTRCGGSGINNLLLAVLSGAHIRLLVLVLFCDERRDVGLETTSTDAHDNKASGKDTQSGLWLDDDLGNSGEDQDDMANNRDNVCPLVPIST